LYNDLVRQKQHLQVIEKSISISEERVTLADERLRLGAGSRLELLQAQVDYNTDRSEQLHSLENYHTSKIMLNNILARDIRIDFEVADEINEVSLPEWNSLYQNTMESNAGLLISLADTRIASLEIREIAAQRFPRLSLNLGYGFVNAESESGFLTLNRTSGINYGLTASVNLFNGFNLNRQAANARIMAENTEIELAEYSASLEAEITAAYISLQSKIQLVDLEDENLEVATKNLDIAMERYRLGELSGIELREAQKNFLSAESRLITSRFQARMVEINLMEISGRIHEGF
jgi:outer membrane protein